MISLTERLADHFRAHPGVWFDGRELAKIGGVYAYRTRISDCRVQLGLNIENRVRVLTYQGEIVPGRSRTFKVSEYRLVDAILPRFRCTCAEMTEPPCSWCDGPDRTPAEFR